MDLMDVDDILDFVGDELSNAIGFVDGKLDEGLPFPELPEASNAVDGGYMAPMLPGDFPGEPLPELVDDGFFELRWMTLGPVACPGIESAAVSPDIPPDIIFFGGAAAMTPPAMEGAEFIIIIAFVGAGDVAPPRMAGAAAIIIIIFVGAGDVGAAVIFIFLVGEGVPAPPRIGDGEGAPTAGLEGEADGTPEVRVNGAADGTLSTGPDDGTTFGAFVDKGKKEFFLGIGVGPGGRPPSPDNGKKMAPARRTGFSVGVSGPRGCRDLRLKTFRICCVGAGVVGRAG